MKKTIGLSVFFLAMGMMFVSCDSKEVSISFAQDEYTLSNNEGISIEQDYKGVTYRMIGKVKEEVHLDSNTGIFTFDTSLPNNTQVLAIAEYKNAVTNPCIVTLTHDYSVADVEFLNLSSYIVDGEFVTASASLPYALTYTLKEQVPGISIDSSTGKVSFTSSVVDGTSFTVVASTHNDAKSEKLFYAMRENFVTVESNRQIAEKGGNLPATFVLDFSNNIAALEEGLLGITTEQNAFIDESFYSFDIETGKLQISASYINTLYDGENILKAITARNTVSLQIDVATKFIYTAEDLASINDSQASLGGYYILMNDLDLSSYFAQGGKGYNSGRGWTPIGLYVDTVDVNVATANAFTGTFDGNGHVISNLYSNRKDVSSFNAGLFGYTTSSSVIKNLGVQGELNVSSYSGGFVGSNNGIITNCWSDVNITVESGEDVYRYVGGFVGNNFGTISSCYSLGDVRCDSYFGSFVGSNEGTIESCYSLKTADCETFVGFGLIDSSCILFEDEASMINADWSSLLSSDDWNIVQGSLPQLKSTIKEYSLRKIQIAPLAKETYYKGDAITIDVLFYPSEFASQYQNSVTLSVDVSGARFNGNVLSTLNARSDVLKVTASVTIEEVTYVDEMTITLGKKIESLTMLTGTEIMKAGSSYRVGASYLPEDANEPISYRISGASLDGITLVDDVITISDDSASSGFDIYAISESGVRSDTVSISINPLTKISDRPVIIYENSSQNAEIELPSNIDTTSLVVKAFGKSIAYTLNNRTLSISRSDLEYLKDTRIPITLEDGDDRYIYEIYYMPHEKYDETYVRSNYDNVITIASKEDFYRYFNMSKTLPYDETKLANYDKVFLLTADIDFGGEEIYAIGYGGDHTFSGIFFGNNHTLSNYRITSNESQAFISGSTSYLYGIALFASLRGEVYDLNINNASMTGNNFVGAIAGMMMEGRVENCSTTNCTVRASGQSTSSGDVRVGSIIGRQYNGRAIACYGNNSMRNIIG